MSLGVVIKGAEGIVLAADSRVTLQATSNTWKGSLPVTYDNATKLLAFSKQAFIGAVTYGQAVIGRRTAQSLLPEFEVELGEERLSVKELASELGKFFLGRWKAAMPKDFKGSAMTFVVAGFAESQAYGEVYLLEIPTQAKPVLRTAVDGFGMTWGGQLDIASRVVQGFDPALQSVLEKESGAAPEDVSRWLGAANAALGLNIPFEFLPLQDCINLATAMIRTTMVSVMRAP